ncbi:RagB/SusD family nutrient uptake outer membrane protein [Chitinophaga ginsengisoli]|uniref:SusD-like starch-binding protein associating with outer membrane n=1 Tax=Chitinophaga ginsengisoli TaxID=363837 RepID=A0A2P8FVU9_9BACT|nr:RagB/SusD family nutrient uptake outer membrane protein [Chitinophaga ginsengisoli]PSL25850.1 SusD-like starch-binding protein associating with outer membrane [Chitinophaga ginsengisoli]
MSDKTNTLKYITLALLLSNSLLFSSCEKFVDIDKAPNQLPAGDAFKEDGTATGAVLAMYTYYTTTGSLPYYTFAGGVEADDIQYSYTSSTPAINELQQSAVSTTNSTVTNYLWIYPYAVIRQANLAIEGLKASTTLTSSVQAQLLGEAYFFRAFNYFYLVNYFGAVPLVLSANVMETGSLPRTGTDSVWTQIISDLKAAEASLPAAYTGTLRTRVNKYAASALLARAYLYREDWQNAITYSTEVIGAGTYSLPTPDSAFVNVSNEVILQYGTTTGYSFLGNNYRTSSSAGIPNYYLYPATANAFETGDKRRTAWVDSVIAGGTTTYRINKYKLATATAGNEYNVILRLAEQYLIRAEANAQLKNLDAAAADLNAVRTRAGLSNTTAATQYALLAAIAKERRLELFGEFAHRWFDLKRTGKVNEVIGAIKSNWASTAALLPIPATEIAKNKALRQNDGY